jgi:hypothetical protein
VIALLNNNVKVENFWRTTNFWRTIFQNNFTVLTIERISKFYEDVEGLKLKFPVAIISKKTEIAKGYVSEVLSKKKEPSEDFIKTFYEKFSIGSETNNDMNNQELPIGNLKVTLKDYVDLLKEQTKKAEAEKDRLYNLLEKQLSELKTNSKEIVEEIVALSTEVQAEHRAMMDSIDVAAKQPIGTTRAAAHSVELASQDEYSNKGKKPNVGKQS